MVFNMYLLVFDISVYALLFDGSIRQYCICSKDIH